MSDGLVEFLRARLDEDEAAAHATSDDEVEEQLGWAEVVVGEAIKHIERHNPARVLAEVDAKRQLINLYETAKHNSELPHPDHVAGVYPPAVFVSGFASALEHALLRLAVVYADHPDYREEWRP